MAIGLTVGDLDLFVADGRNWDTMGRFAFASRYMPGSGDDRLFIDEVVTPTWGAHSPKKNLARRLHFEAYTFVASEIFRNEIKGGAYGLRPAEEDGEGRAR